MTLDIEQIRARLHRARTSLDTIGNVLSLSKASGSHSLDVNQLKKAQKAAILDSYHVKMLHLDFKTWENEQENQFIELHVQAYNKKFAQVGRLHEQVDLAEQAHEEAIKVVQIPDATISISTLRKYANGRYLEYVSRDESGSLPASVKTSQLFSPDGNSGLARPDYHVFNDLLQAEFRQRMLLQIKYEVLCKVKSDVSAKNRQWATRDVELNRFVNEKLRQQLEEVQKIKASEYEDLRDYEDDVEEDDDIDNDDEDDEDEDNIGDDDDGDDDNDNGLNQGDAHDGVAEQDDKSGRNQEPIEEDKEMSEIGADDAEHISRHLEDEEGAEEKGKIPALTEEEAEEHANGQDEKTLDPEVKERENKLDNSPGTPDDLLEDIAMED